MKRFNSLKKNQDFQTVYHGGKSYANKYLVMYAMSHDAVSNLFAGGNADPRVLPSRIHHVHDQIFVMRDFYGFIDLVLQRY